MILKLKTAHDAPLIRTGKTTGFFSRFFLATLSLLLAMLFISCSKTNISDKIAPYFSVPGTFTAGYTINKQSGTVDITKDANGSLKLLFTSQQSPLFGMEKIIENDGVTTRFNNIEIKTKSLEEPVSQIKYIFTELSQKTYVEQKPFVKDGIEQLSYEFNCEKGTIKLWVDSLSGKPITIEASITGNNILLNFN